MTTLTALPPAPQRSDPANFPTKADAWVTAIETVFTPQMNLIIPEVNAAASAAATSAATASGYVATVAASASAAASSAILAADQASIAQGAANNKGNWSALTGALNMPASVVHNSKVWVLVNNIVNVTLSQPGVTTDWFDITASENPYVCGLKQINVALTTAAVHIPNSIVVIDANRTLLLTNSSLGAHAVVYDNTTGTCGTAVLVRSGANSLPQGLLCGTNSVLVCSCTQSTTAFEAVVLSISGTTITVNTAATRTLAENSNMFGTPIAVGSSYIFVVAGVSNLGAISVTVSGTTATIGTAVSSHTGSSGCYIHPIDSTRFLLTGRDNGTLIYATPYSVSGTTLTKGTSATFTGSVVQTVCSLDSGRVAVVYSNTATWGAIITVTSTTATASTVQLGTNPAVNGGGTKIGANQLIVAAAQVQVNVLTDVGGVATAGTILTALTGLINLASPIGYGSDYVTFGRDTSGTISLSTVKISGNNAIIHSASSCRISCISGSDISQVITGTPSNILSKATKSVAVIGAPTGSIPAYAIECGVGYKNRILHPVPIISVKESDSVTWASYSNSTSTLITFNRLELT